MEKSIDRMCEMRIRFYFLKSNYLSRSQIVLVETTLVLQKYYKMSVLLSLWPASIMESVQPNNTSQQLSSITSPWRLEILLLLCKQTLRLAAMSLLILLSDGNPWESEYCFLSLQIAHLVWSGGWFGIECLA